LDLIEQVPVSSWLLPLPAAAARAVVVCVTVTVGRGFGLAVTVSVTVGPGSGVVVTVAVTVVAGLALVSTGCPLLQPLAATITPATSRPAVRKRMRGRLLRALWCVVFIRSPLAFQVE
jgi:hypothetical protein